MGGSLMELAEDDYAGGGADVDFAIGDHRRDEFVVGELVAAGCGLIAVVELGGEIGGVVSVEDTG